MRGGRTHIRYLVAGGLLLALVVVLGLLSRHALRSGRRPQPITAARERTVHAPWFVLTREGPTAGVSGVNVRVEPPKGDGIRIGFFEGEAEGTGDAWRAAAWMAAIVASLTEGRDLTQYVPSFEVGGRIDGPSAGALLAVGVLAALEDQELRPKATMTGALQPDGAIGPVAGVLHKVQAAIDAGNDLVLIPRGQRTDTNYTTNQPVDVVKAAEVRGVTVREVGDLAEAYEQLTGDRLPLPPLARREPELPAAVRAKLSEGAREWLARCRAELLDCERLSRELRGRMDLAAERAAAEKTAARAEALLNEGRAAAGHERAVIATLQAAVVATILGSVRTLSSGGPAAAADGLLDPPGRPAWTEAFLGRTASLPLTDPDEALARADACGTAAQDLGLREALLALTEEVRTAGDEGMALDPLLKASVLRGIGRHSAQIAEDRLALASGRSSKRRVDAARLSAWAETMERGASANLTYFEAVCIQESARQLGLQPGAVRDALAYQDLTYLQAESSLAALPRVKSQLGPERAPGAVLGAAVGAYAAASALQARFYSLRGRFGEQGEATGVEDQEGLTLMLEAARAKARASIAAAQADGLSAAVPTFYYQVGAAYAEGDAGEKLDSLQYLWQATLYARLEALFAAR